MKLHSLIPTVVLSMAVLVQAQSNPAPQAPKAATVLGGSNAAETKPPEAIQPGDGKELIVNADGSVTLSAGTLGAVIAEIEQRIEHWPLVEGGDEPAMPNLLYGADTRGAAVPADLRLRGVSLMQAITLAAAAAGCTLEPVFSPTEEAGGVGGSGSAKPQTIIGYRVVLETNTGRALNAAQQFAELDRQLNTLSATLGQNHPRVVSAREHIKQLMARKIETPSGANSKIPVTKIPATVRGRLIDQLGKGLGGKPLVFVKDGSTVITDGPTSADGTFQFELPVDQKWQVVLLEDGKLTGPRSEEMTTPTPGSSTSDEPNYDLDLHLDGTRLKAQLTELKLSEKAADGMPKVRVVNSPSAPPGADSMLANGIYGGGVAPEHVVPYAAFSGLATPSSRGNGPFVQVYAVGTLLSGSVSEISEKENCFRELVSSAIAMDRVARGDKTPDLNFHKQSQALIVSATAGQHEIIDQVIKAMKENATHPPAPKKP